MCDTKIQLYYKFACGAYEKNLVTADILTCIYLFSTISLKKKKMFFTSFILTLSYIFLELYTVTVPL